MNGGPPRRSAEFSHTTGAYSPCSGAMSAGARCHNYFRRCGRLSLGKSNLREWNRREASLVRIQLAGSPAFGPGGVSLPVDSKVSMPCLEG